MNPVFKSNQFKVLAIFIVTYVVIFLLGNFTSVKNWNVTNFFQADYMAILIPIPAFFLTYFLMGWAEKTLETRAMHRIMFIPTLIITAIIAYWVQLRWYYWNIEILNLDRGIEVAYIISIDFPCTSQGVTICFWEFFIVSHFLLFLLGMIGGWVAGRIADRDS